MLISFVILGIKKERADLNHRPLDLQSNALRLSYTPDIILQELFSLKFFTYSTLLVNIHPAKFCFSFFLYLTQCQKFLTKPCIFGDGAVGRI